MNPPKIRAALIDLSGTLHIGDTPIPGAVEAMQRLVSRIPTIFITNTTKISSSSLKQQLEKMGFPTCEIMTSTLAARNYIKENNLRPYCLLEDTSDFEDSIIVMEPPYNCVVVGLAPTKLDYHHLNQAYQILRDSPQHQLIAIHRANYYRDASHQLSLGPGGFVTLLEQVSAKEAVVIGKPNSAFFQAALNELEGIPSQNVCMVGDDVLGDILGAHEAGIGTAILVTTGKYQPSDREKARHARVVPSIVEAVDYILEHVNIDTHETS
jgi:HAD superfamily hydrolase (TIGR01458 family)